MPKALPWLRTPRGPLCSQASKSRLTIMRAATSTRTTTAGDLIIHTGGHDARIQQFTPGPPCRPNVWMQYDIVATGNHYEVTLTDTENGATQLTTVFDNTDSQRGVATVGGAPAGYIGIQSYPNSPVAFRDIWIN
ncbi:MAG: hypothetical protein DMG57_16135 [Acidobacteria bacterium]|nr:MAG: hypothetical protein DMG57_16135 [Acidobacteriota bacterium]